MRASKTSWFVLVLTVLALRTAPGQSLVKDITPTNAVNSMSSVSQLPGAVVGSHLYFAANDGVRGEELWKTDGTIAGTSLVLDIYRGSPGANPKWFTPFQGLLFFVATDFSGNYELWRTDGTPAGTYQVCDCEPGPQGSNPMLLTVAGSRLFFVARTTAAGAELWCTDGTVAGTRMLEIQAGTANGFPASLVFPNVVAAIGDRVVFPGISVAEGQEPWVSDGTPAGTSLLKDVYPGRIGNSLIGGFTGLRGRLYFAANDGIAGIELWSTDGTTAGTSLFKDITPGGNSSSPEELAVWSDRLVFSAVSGSSGREPWVSDGTAAGTELLKDINPGTGWSSPTMFRGAASQVFFLATLPSTGRELWRTDGTANGTRLVADLVPGSGAPSFTSMATLGDRLGFACTWSSSPFGTELWASDGTSEGTVLVKDIAYRTNASLPVFLTAYRGALWFAATDEVRGREPWRSDLTAGGTAIFADLNTGPNPPSAIGGMTALGTKLVFTARDPRYGTELWVTDGIEAGTSLLKDIDPRPARPGVATEPERIVFGDVMLFAADDGVAGIELWKTDGTEAGTVLLKDIYAGFQSASPNSFVRLGKKVYCFATTTLGRELWVTDGTAAGTQLVKDVNVGAGHGAGYDSLGFGQRAMAAVGGRLFFAGTDAANGTELWTSDGTEAGTTLVADIVPGATGSRPLQLTHYGDLVVFVAGAPATATRPWRSDSTTAGTFQLSDVGPGLTMGLEHDGIFYFTNGNGQAGWGSLYRTDGTVGGTTHVFTNALFGGPIAAGKLFMYIPFSQTINGAALIVSDGTTAGTQLLRMKTLLGGQGSYLVPVGQSPLIVFSADDGLGSGVETWVSDGTSGGTRLAFEIRPGPDHGSPLRFTQAGTQMFFLADDGVHGRELWVVPLAKLGGGSAGGSGPGCPGLGGRLPDLAATASPRIGNPLFGLRLSNALPLAPATLFLSVVPGRTPIGGGCTVYLGTVDAAIERSTNALGSTGLALPIPNDPRLVGGEFFAQAAVIDPGGAWFNVVALSNGLWIVIGQ